MPNGGSDNCENCAYLEGGAPRPSPMFDLGMPVFSKCLIRGIMIENTHWTYCANQRTGSPEPDGPVFGRGRYEKGYCRIPWHGRFEPQLRAAGVCDVCGRMEDNGLMVGLEGDDIAVFCCNRHYMDWWKKQHGGEKLAWEYEFDEPETSG